jgi:hypothetical protein
MDGAITREWMESMREETAMRKILSMIGAACLLASCASSQEAAQPTSPPAAGQPAPKASAPAASASAVAEISRPLAGQPTFKSPDEAASAMYKAASSKDLAGMAKIAGLPLEEVTSGDPAKDQDLAAKFAAAYDEFHRIVPDPKDPRRSKVFIGKDNYPVASPLVKTDSTWYFDSAGGMEELRARVIGENELNTIGVCRAYVQAQYEYYSEDRNGDDVLQYAQHLGSTKGAKDGLYWPTKGDEPASPLGPLVADARATGYLRGSARNLESPKPYHGYLFQVLSAQGAHAAGGAYSYVINGRMIAGFALVAVPAKYGKTGIMTFQVGANGKVYQKDFKGETPAPYLESYDPDGSWSLVTE